MKQFINRQTYVIKINHLLLSKHHSNKNNNPALSSGNFSVSLSYSTSYCKLRSSSFDLHLSYLIFIVVIHIFSFDVFLIFIFSLKTI